MADGRETVSFNYQGKPYSADIPGGLADDDAQNYIRNVVIPKAFNVKPEQAPIAQIPGDTPVPPDVAARHARQALSKQAEYGGYNKSRLEAGPFSIPNVGDQLRSAAEGIGGLAKGAAGMVGNLPANPTDFGQALKFAQGMVAPQQEQFQRASETMAQPGRGVLSRTTEAGGHLLAGATPLVGPMAAQAGESFGSGELLRGAIETAAAIGPEKLMKMLRPATDLVRTGDAITNGMTTLAKDQVRPTVEKFVNATKQEVARHADAVIAADEARAARGSRVTPQTNDAANAAQAKIDSMRGYTPSERVMDFVTEARQPGTLASVKQLIGDVSDAIGKANRAKMPEDAAVLSELRTGLKNAAQTHAEGLGPEYGASWKQYREVHAAKVERLSELLGDLREGLAGPDTINKLVNQDNAAQFHQLVREMKDYGVDTKPLESAREYGYKLQDTLSKNGNLFFGKLRAMIKYPWAAAPVAVGAAEVAKLTSLPGMGFVLPLIAAGKVAKLLDMRQLRILLKDIQEQRMIQGAGTPEALRSPYERPMPPPLKPPSGLGDVDTPGGETEGERLIRTGSATRETPAPTKEEVAGAAERKERAEAEERLNRQGLAGKLKGARRQQGSRSQSGVYGGSRGGSK